jgi:hypothetical protein
VGLGTEKYPPYFVGTILTDINKISVAERAMLAKNSVIKSLIH